MDYVVVYKERLGIVDVLIRINDTLRKLKLGAIYKKGWSYSDMSGVFEKAGVGWINSNK